MTSGSCKVLTVRGVRSIRPAKYAFPSHVWKSCRPLTSTDSDAVGQRLFSGPLKRCWIATLFLGCCGCGQARVEVPTRFDVPKQNATTYQIGLSGVEKSGRLTLVKLELPQLPNIHKLGESVYFGGQTQGEAGFRQLRDLKIQTVISVDGARPNIEAA